MNCGKAEELLVQENLGNELRGKERAFLSDHVAVCESCSDFKEMFVSLPQFRFETDVDFRPTLEKPLLRVRKTEHWGRLLKGGLQRAALLLFLLLPLEEPEILRENFAAILQREKVSLTAALGTRLIGGLAPAPLEHFELLWQGKMLLGLLPVSVLGRDGYFAVYGFYGNYDGFFAFPSGSFPRDFEDAAGLTVYPKTALVISRAF